jgi:hypothetical protein
MSKPQTGWHYKLGNSVLQKDILRVVNYWHPRATAFRDGERWLVLGVDELQERLNDTGQGGKKPSERSIQRALAHLRGEGILITEHHRHPFRNVGGSVLWIRPDVERIGGLLSARCRVTGGQLAATNIQSTSEQKTGKGHNSDTPAGGSPDNPSGLFDDQEDDVQGADFLKTKKKKATVEDALAVFSVKKTAQDYPSIAKPEIAHKALRDACIAAGFPNPGAFNTVVGGKMKTMLNRFKAEGVGPEKAAALIFFLASKWGEFTGYMSTTFGVVVKGSAPNVSAMTLYAVEAAGFWKSYSDVQSPVQETVGEHGSSLDEGF